MCRELRENRSKFVDGDPYFISAVNLARREQGKKKKKQRKEASP